MAAQRRKRLQTKPASEPWSWRRVKRRDAEAAFLKAVEFDPKLYRAWYYLGRIAHHAGDEDKEVGYFKKAIELDPDDWESPILLLSPLRERGNEAEVQATARLAVERVEKHLEETDSAD